MGTGRGRGPDMDAFFSTLLWLSAAAIIFALYLCFEENHGEGCDIY